MELRSKRSHENEFNSVRAKTANRQELVSRFLAEYDRVEGGVPARIGGFEIALAGDSLLRERIAFYEGRPDKPVPVEDEAVLVDVR
ncbi:MAG TPA: hypothetical protein VLF41_02735 [Candidatus Nanoarchaeia archaeon]|nr:hypothetical protein [Candidatus Nanoarchaeia archaeon]